MTLDLFISMFWYSQLPNDSAIQPESSSWKLKDLLFASSRCQVYSPQGFCLTKQDYEVNWITA